MSKSKGILSSPVIGVFWGVVAATAIGIIVGNIGFVSKALLVVAGFGVVILIHEFGHFIIAKFSDINVQAFSIGFPPTVFGLKRTNEGYRLRLLPDFLGKKKKTEDEGEENDDDAEEEDEENRGIKYIIGKESDVEWETEYRLGLIPFGGYVKMLGQEDMGKTETTNDPRSFANKGVGVRFLVIAAGVVFNVIGALIIFMIAFSFGVHLPPPVIGGVTPGLPADMAGLQAGDEIVSIGDKSEYIDFMDVAMAGALSDRGEKIPMKVMHRDGSIEQLSLSAELMPDENLRGFGIRQAYSLQIENVSDDWAKELEEKTGLKCGDVIKSVEGVDVDSSWEVQEVIQNSFKKNISVLVDREVKKDTKELINKELNIEVVSILPEEKVNDLRESYIYSMVPKLKLMRVSVENDKDNAIDFKDDDILLQTGDIEFPTYKEMRQATERHEGKEMLVKVSREIDGSEKEISFVVKPKRMEDSNQVHIGFRSAFTFDMDSTLVAKTVKVGDFKLDIPKGARITSVAGVEVSDFYEVVQTIRDNIGEKVTIAWYIDGKSGEASFVPSGREDMITAKCVFAEPIPFKILERLYKAKNPVEGVVIGYYKTITFIGQTYATLKSLFSGTVSPKSLMGPVGILKLGYRIVSEKPLMFYFYYLGLINACIAVVNFLPLPPTDGGLAVFMIIEKIKGSAVSIRVQEVVMYAGWILIGTFFLYVTFNDIIR